MRTIILMLVSWLLIVGLTGCSRHSICDRVRKDIAMDIGFELSDCNSIEHFTESAIGDYTENVVVPLDSTEFESLLKVIRGGHKEVTGANNWTAYASGYTLEIDLKTPDETKTYYLNTEKRTLGMVYIEE